MSRTKSIDEEKINGGDILVQCLLNEGVKYLFGICGGELLPIYDAIYRWGKEKGIQTIMMRHEQAGAHAADAYARTTGEVGVCFGTVGPGVTHMIPAVGTAYMDSVPLVVIGAQIRRDQEGIGLFQGDVDQISLMKPITKFQIQVDKPEEIPNAVQKCFNKALSGRSRPVYMDIRVSALVGKLDKNFMESLVPPAKYRPYEKPSADPKLIDQALSLIKSAKKPLIVGGGGINSAQAWQELQDFSVKYKIPAITTITGIGAIARDKETYVGSYIASTTLMHTARTADLVLSLGCKWDYTMLYGQSSIWSSDQKLIQVDIDPLEIGKNRKVDVGIIADCKTTLNQFLEKADKYLNSDQFKDWNIELQEEKEKEEQTQISVANSEKIPIAPERFLKEIFEFFPSETIIMLDAGDLAVFAYSQINTKARPPRSVHYPINMGQLGVGIPWTIGAKFAHPDKPVINICGDGSFLFNVQDLDTAVRYKLPIINIIGNNGCWGMIKSGQKYNWGKRYCDTEIEGTDYAQIAKGFGCYAETVEKPEDIQPALERAVNSGLPAVIDVKIAWKTPTGTRIIQQMKKRQITT
jgi:acetolactate synthase-1/2/3 large subunit